MLTWTAYGNSRLSLWLRVREFAVPPSMIETATARRSAGDWAGACAAAGVDVDLDLRSVARTHGSALAARVRADLRRLAPDLLRWHMPRIAPDGLLRPALTLSLARYDAPGQADAGPLHLVARTPPSWADAGQRIALSLWDGSSAGYGAGRHPHPRPHRRYRLDLHRHLWDARRTAELRERAGAGDPAPPVPSPPEPGCNVGRWAAEAAILLRAEGRADDAFTVRCGSRNRLVLELTRDEDGVGPPALRLLAAAPGRGGPAALPVLPDAATRTPPDLELLRAGLLEPSRLHPLVASALAPGTVPPDRPAPTGDPRVVECRGARHRLGLVDGALAPLDHDPAEIRREELLMAFGGPPLPCLRVIDEAHRRPDCLTGVRERLEHGDITGALAVVEALLGPAAVLRDGPLRDALSRTAARRTTHALYRAGLTGPGRAPTRDTPRHTP
ncbi:hypothetical protein [Streptomyces sp. NPDC047028]|uniref:hypothetical protein n=1 Tax=Streptomyces sp. NPDC047028 TaxID=3155793 RepID=UPI0033D5CB96